MLKIKEFDDVIRHIEGKAYNSAIVLLRAMKHDAESAEALKPPHNRPSAPCEYCIGAKKQLDMNYCQRCGRVLR